jgi:hypothetical protein
MPHLTPSPLHRRQRHRTAGLQGSWATICVVGEKSKPRETAGGASLPAALPTSCMPCLLLPHRDRTAHPDMVAADCPSLSLPRSAELMIC